jgi:hypothetical protein
MKNKLQLKAYTLKRVRNDRLFDNGMIDGHSSITIFATYKLALDFVAKKQLDVPVKIIPIEIKILETA